MSQAYEIENEKGQIVIRFKSDLVDRNALGKLLDYIELESIRQRSELTPAQAADLAGDIDQAVWQQIKHKYTGE